LKQNPVAVTWQNGYGVASSCSNLVSLFSMDDVARLRKDDSECLIATFSGTQFLKI
jgi:hypothetical protein